MKRSECERIFARVEPMLRTDGVDLGLQEWCWQRFWDRYGHPGMIFVRHLGNAPQWTYDLPASDHLRLFRRTRVGTMLVSMPYGIDAHEAKLIGLAAQKRRLEVRIEPFGWHYPGQTVLIAWWRGDRRPEHDTA